MRRAAWSTTRAARSPRCWRRICEVTRHFDRAALDRLTDPAKTTSASRPRYRVWKAPCALTAP